ncbi:glycosyltransferase family 39 protein [Patescibacteria group bacterium]|nr:glycosyltransferase family 39 protein [Patescibacteria group bacterium]
MNDTLRNLRFWLVVLTFIILAIFKLHGYDRMPQTSHAEELLYGWSGIHLIETGVPVSWSTLDYPKENIVFDGIVGDPSNVYLPATLYKPWLDEPPLYSLLSGGVAHLYGDDRWDVLPVSHTRIPSVLASLVTTILIFFVGNSFFGYGTGLLAMIIYGLSPIMVFGSRLSVPENIIAMAVMIGLLLAKKYKKKPETGIAVIFGVITVILGLMKPTGFFFAPLAMFLVAQKKRWKDFWLIGGLMFVGILLFLAYGYWLDWDMFLEIVRIQGGRFAGWSGLGHIFTSPAFDIFLMFDGWYIFCMISALFWGIKGKGKIGLKLINLFFFYWLMVTLLSGTEGDLLPWYRYPLFPLLAVYGALGLKWIYKNINLLGLTLVIGMLLSSRYYLHNAFRPTTPTIVYRLSFCLGLLPLLLNKIWPKKLFIKISRGVVIVVVALGLFFNAKYIYSVFEIRCESIECPFGPSTKLSEVYMPVFWRWFVMKDPTGMLDENRPWF